MKLTITDNIKISEIQNEFNRLFPYLKVEFYKHMHAEGEGSQKSDTIDNNLTIFDVKQKNIAESIEVEGNMTVTALETAFAEQFELSVQVFRKSGNIWLQTTATDHLTLNEQNEKAAEWIQDEKMKDEDVPNAMDHQDRE